jgi:Cys-rich four helix bundle protein (predicted Tat secretion target)
MERRESMTTLGAAAAVLSAMPALAEGAKPGAQHMHPPKYKTLSDAAGKCLVDGDYCLGHCFGMRSMNDASLAGCSTASFDVIAGCRALETLAAVNSAAVSSLVKVTADICLACKKECDKFPQYCYCLAIGESCKACAEEGKTAAS